MNRHSFTSPYCLEDHVGIEPTTKGFRDPCSTAEANGPINLEPYLQAPAYNTTPRSNRSYILQLQIIGS